MADTAVGEHDAVLRRAGSTGNAAAEEMHLGDVAVLGQDRRQPFVERPASFLSRLAVQGRGARVPEQAARIILQLPNADIRGFQRQIEPLRQFQQFCLARLQRGNVAIALAEQEGREEDRHDNDEAGGKDDQTQLGAVFGYRVPAAVRDGGKLPLAAGKADLLAHRILAVDIGRPEERRREKRCGGGRRGDIPDGDRKMVEMRIAFLVLAVACRHQPGRLVEHRLVDGDLDRPQIRR